MEFTLTIKLGNEAMQTPSDVRDLLLKVAKDLEAPEEWNEHDAGGHPLRDSNGNRVGHWQVS